MIIFSRDEEKQNNLDISLKNHKHYNCLRFFIGDVRDKDRLEMALRGVDYVVHAAALKHVSSSEYNPFECIRTNVNGAENIVQASIKAGVKKVIALSTDKAANPINLYGASKLASDKIMVAANHLSTKNNTLFSVVRYGNVIGSRGSVIPLFKKLINDGNHFFPITDPEMTRFWITIDQGVKFVLSSMSIMQGGEIFVPKIPSAKIIDIALAMAPNFKQKIIGIRPGEKLHEVMISKDDARSTIELNDRFIIQPLLYRNWDKDYYLKKGAKPVQKSFSYTSDQNSEWLNKNQILKILNTNLL